MGWFCLESLDCAQKFTYNHPKSPMDNDAFGEGCSAGGGKGDFMGEAKAKREALAVCRILKSA